MVYRSRRLSYMLTLVCITVVSASCSVDRGTSAAVAPAAPDDTGVAASILETAEQQDSEASETLPVEPSLTRPASQNDGRLSELEFEDLFGDGSDIFEGTAVLRERAVAEATGGVVCEIAELKLAGQGSTEISVWLSELADGFGSPSPGGDALAASAAANRMCADLLFLVEVDWPAERSGGG
jgi:hypothetical protein